MLNYLDEDVAYLIGMVCVRGRIVEGRGDRSLIIGFPFKTLVAKGLTKEFDRAAQLKLGIYDFRERLFELLGTDIEIKETRNSFELIIRFPRNTMAWRDIKILTQNKFSYADFTIPPNILDASTSIKKSFVRGMADAAAEIGLGADHPWNKKHRVVIAFNENWILPIQLCRLLQNDLKVPVDGILWGHPNIRDPQVRNPRVGIREHQFRIYSEAFEKIGFDIGYKNEILEELVKDDRDNHPGKIHFCNLSARERRTKKKRHPQEKNKNLPKTLYGCHFGTCREICRALGCHEVKSPIYKGK